jgi:hypothetical protein
MDSTEAEAWFNERGWRLRVYEESGKVWADLVSADSDFTVPKYGSGESADAAIVRAKRRWDVEQEPHPPTPRRFP